MLNRIWITLSVLFFGTQCAIRLQPYLKGIGAKRPQTSEAPPRTSVPRTLRLASWNMQFLDVPGRGPDKRDQADYAALARYAGMLDADVVAVQEVASEEALALVFPPAVYAYHLASPGGSQRTGFVYRKTLETRVYPDLAALALHDLRAGSDLGVRVLGREIRLLAVHMKAFCVSGSLTRKQRDCEKLNAQLPVLEGWIDQRARESTPFAVLGDFNRTIGEPGDAMFEELDDGEPKTLKLTLAGARRHSSCHPEHKRSAIDHVLLGGALDRWLATDGLSELLYSAGDREARLKLSDHCPIRVTLQPPASP